MIRSLKQPYRWIVDVLIFAALSPFAWWIADREPPWERLYGVIKPTHAGDTFQVRWYNTPLKRECPGTLQVEIISGYIIWPVLRRQVNSNLEIGQREYLTPPWPLAITVPPGKSVYRVTSFWYCNWLQEFLGWAVIQVGPDIEFEVLPAVVPHGATVITPPTRPETVPGPATSPIGPAGDPLPKGAK